MELRKCYYCKRGDDKSEMIQEEHHRNEKLVYRYYHNECKYIETENRLGKKRRTRFGNTEGKEHSEYKKKIYKLLSKRKLKLIDQFGNEIHMEGELFMESPLSREYKNQAPFNDKSTCNQCFSKYGMGLNTDHCNMLRNRIVDYKPIKNGDHPCLECPFNMLGFKFVFDLAFASNGHYHTAIEILNTSKCKKEKLLHCIKHKINLYEVKIDKELKDGVLNVQSLWWINDSGIIEIHNSYK